MVEVSMRSSFDRKSFSSSPALQEPNRAELIGGRSSVSWDFEEENRQSDRSVSRGPNGTPTRTSLQSCEGAASVPPNGTKVLAYMGSSQLRATMKFVGPTSFASGLWVGVELELPQGRNDGSVKGVRYFHCDPDHGLFVRPQAIVKDGDQGSCPPSSRGAVRATSSGGHPSCLRKDSTRSLGSSEVESHSFWSCADHSDNDNEDDDDELPLPFRRGATLADEELTPRGQGRGSIHLDLQSDSMLGAASSDATQSRGRSIVDLVQMVAQDNNSPPSDSVDKPLNAVDTRPPKPPSTLEAPRPSKKSLRKSSRENREFRRSPSAPSLGNSDGSCQETPRRKSTVQRKTVDLGAARQESCSGSGPFGPRLPLTASNGLGRGSSPCDGQAVDLTVHRKNNSCSPSTSSRHAESESGQVPVVSPYSNATTSPSTAGLPLASPSMASDLGRSLNSTFNTTGATAAAMRDATRQTVAAAQRSLAQAVEDHDSALIRRLLPHACEVGVDASELAGAQHILQFEYQRSLLFEIDDVRNAVAVLAETVHAAERRAAEHSAEMHSERSWSKATSSTSPISAAQATPVSQDDGWLLKIVESVEKKVWETLDFRMEDFRTSVTQAATELTSAVAEIKRLRSSLAGPTCAAARSPGAGTPARSPGSGGKRESDSREEQMSILRGALIDSQPMEPTFSLGSLKMPQAEDEEIAAHLIQRHERGRSARQRVRRIRSEVEEQGRGTGKFEQDEEDEDDFFGISKVATLDTRVMSSVLSQSRAFDASELADSSPERAAPEGVSDFFEVVAEESDIKLGFRPSGMPPDQVFVITIDPDSWSSRSGLQVDDELVSIGISSVADMDRDDFLTRLKHVRPLKLAFLRTITQTTPSSAVGSAATLTTPNGDARKSSRKSSEDTQDGGARPWPSPGNSANLVAPPQVRDSRCSVMDLPSEDLLKFQIPVTLPPAPDVHQRRHSNPLSSLSPKHRSADPVVRRHSNPLVLSAEISQASPAAGASPFGMRDLRSPFESSLGATESLQSTFGSPTRIGRSPRGRRVGRAATVGHLSARSQGGTPPFWNAGDSRGNVLELPVDAVVRERSSPRPQDDYGGRKSPRGGCSPRSPAQSPAAFLASILPPISPCSNTPSPYTTEIPGAAIVAASIPTVPPLPPSVSSHRNFSDSVSPVPTVPPLRTEIPKTGESPSMDVTFQPTSLARDANVFEALAKEEDVPLGFKPNAMPPEKVYVEEVDAGSWSDLHGLSRGDELVACNGEPVSQLTGHMLSAIMKLRPLRLSFVRAAAGSGAGSERRDTIDPRSQPPPLTSSSETAVASTMPDTESSVSYVEESYLYTPSTVMHASGSRNQGLADSSSPAWTSQQQQQSATPATTPRATLDISGSNPTPTNAPSATLDISSSSTSRNELSDSLRAALFAEEPMPELAMSPVNDLGVDSNVPEHGHGSSPPTASSQGSAYETEDLQAKTPSFNIGGDASSPSSPGSAWTGMAVPLVIEAAHEEADSLGASAATTPCADVTVRAQELPPPSPAKSMLESDGEDMSF